jgi:hypothetical protein
MSLVLAAASPGLGGLLGQQRYDRAAVLRREIMALNWAFITVVGSTILLWNRAFLQLWVGRDQYAGLLTDVLLVMLMAQTVFIRSDAYLIDVTLQLRRKVIVSAVAGCVTVGLSLLLTPAYGSVGVCCGALGGRLLLTVCYPRIVNRYLGVRSARWNFRKIRPWVLTGILFACSAYCGQYTVGGSWFALPLGALASVVLFSGIALFVGLPMDVRAAVLHRIKVIRLGITR